MYPVSANPANPERKLTFSVEGFRSSVEERERQDIHALEVLVLELSSIFNTRASMELGVSSE